MNAIEEKDAEIKRLKQSIENMSAGMDMLYLLHRDTDGHGPTSHVMREALRMMQAGGHTLRWGDPKEVIHRAIECGIFASERCAKAESGR